MTSKHSATQEHCQKVRVFGYLSPNYGYATKAARPSRSALLFNHYPQMKYTIHVNQMGADTAGLRDVVDIIDLAIFDAFKDFANSNRCEKMMDDAGRIWFWIDYALIIKELPYCNLKTKDGIYRRMRKLAEANIIEFHPDNQKMGKSFFSWSTNYDALVTTKSQDENPKGDQDLRTDFRRGTDKNPKTYGRKTEAPTDKNPNDHNTNNPNTNQQTKASTAAVASDGQGPTVIVIETVEAKDGKNGTASRGAGPQTKSWTRMAAEVFDEVSAEKCRENMIDYQPFNWSVCQEENFRQLRNLREKAITPDFKAKFRTEPTEEQIIGSFRAVFRLAWDYFRRIQKETGGALHYTPTSVYKSYNNIKTTAKNGNINGSAVVGSDGKTYQFGQGINDTGTFDPKRGY